MTKSLSTFLLLIIISSFALSLSGCDSSKEAVNPGTGTAAKPAEATTDPNISFGSGFYQLEKDNTGNSWHWMSGEGAVKLKNTGKEMKLSMTGSVPMEAFPKDPPTMKVTLNGEQIDQFPAQHSIVKEYSIPAAKQGDKEYSDLRILTSKTFVPKQRDPKSGDERQLGFSLLKLGWDAK